MEPEIKENILDQSISNDILNNTEIHYNNNDIMELKTNEDVFADLKLKENIENVGTIKKGDLDISNISICSNDKSKNEESDTNSVIYMQKD